MRNLTPIFFKRNVTNTPHFPHALLFYNEMTTMFFIYYVDIGSKIEIEWQINLFIVNWECLEKWGVPITYFFFNRS